MSLHNGTRWSARMDLSWGKCLLRRLRSLRGGCRCPQGGLFEPESRQYVPWNSDEMAVSTSIEGLFGAFVPLRSIAAVLSPPDEAVIGWPGASGS